MTHEGKGRVTSRVSIVIPSYNYGRFIARAVDSALAQDGVDVDVVVVDDGSSDDSLEVLAAYGDRIRVFRQPHGGAARARNHGIDKASGEFIAFLDADDWLLEGSLDRRCRFLKAHPQFDWVYGARQVANVDGAIIGAYPDYFGHPDGHLQGDVTRSLIRAFAGIHTLTSLFRLADVRAVGGFCDRYEKFEDYDFLLRMSAGRQVGFCADGFFGVQRLHESPLSLDYELGYRCQLRLLQEFRRAHGRDARLAGAFRDRISGIHNYLACIDIEKGRPLSALADSLHAIACKPLQRVAYRLMLSLLLGRAQGIAAETLHGIYADKGSGRHRGGGGDG